MYALISKERTIFGTGSQGLYKSEDGGLKWESFDPGFGYIENGDIFEYSGIVFAMLAKTGKTYYFTYNNDSNKWDLFDYQLGTTIYKFTVSGDKIFAARFDGLYYRDVKVTSVEKPLKQPKEFMLYQNYPNPFNAVSKINYSVPQISFVTIKVYDFLGREIITLVNSEKSIGNYSITFDASKLSSGIYYYRMRVGDFVSTKKLVLLK